MKSIGKLAFALVLAGGLAAPAFAASTTSSTSDATDPGQNAANSQSSTSGDANAATPGQTDPAANMRMSQKIRDDLAKGGFTDIRIMPESFLVRAKDSQGNPVMMVINPDSVMAVTEDTQGTNAASNATHTNQNNAGATQGDNGGAQPAQPNAAKP